MAICPLQVVAVDRLLTPPAPQALQAVSRAATGTGLGKQDVVVVLLLARYEVNPLKLPPLAGHWVALPPATSRTPHSLHLGLEAGLKKPYRFSLSLVLGRRPSLPHLW